MSFSKNAFALSFAVLSLTTSPAVVAAPRGDGGTVDGGGRVQTPASIFTAHLIGVDGEQSSEQTDLGLITFIQYTANQSTNQIIYIVAEKDGKTNVCALQFHIGAMAQLFGGTTRAETIETYKSVIETAKSPSGKIVCKAQPQFSPGGGFSSIGDIGYSGALYLISFGSTGNGFNLITK